MSGAVEVKQLKMQCSERHIVMHKDEKPRAFHVTLVGHEAFARRLNSTLLLQD